MSIENLMAGHAYWSKERKRLKDLGSVESSLCTRGSADRFFRPSSTCFDVAFQILKENDEYNEPNRFEDIWDDGCEDFEPCQHCKNVRTLKRERGRAGTRLGAIRSAITRIGSKLEYIDGMGVSK